MNVRALISTGLLLLTPVHLEAQEGGPAQQAMHDELRALRDKATAALDSMDLDALFEHLHENVVFTPMNAEVCRGHGEVRAYFDKMLKGPDRIVESVSITFTVDSLSDLYGPGTAVAHGSSNERYKLADGLELEVNNKWTSTLVKEEGKWLIVSLHASGNLFDNPLLEKMAASLYWAAAAAGVVGAVVGMVLARALRKKQS